MIKLVDIESVEEEDVTFGTCELCFRVMDYTFEYFIFEDDKTGERHSILNGEWDWGDFYEDIWLGIDGNICDIADFLIKKNIQTFEELESKWGDILSEYKQQNCLEEDYEEE